MSGYKFVDGSKPIGFMYPYQDVMISMTEALKNQEHIAYIDLVQHLKNMSILSFDKKDICLLEKLEDVVYIFKKHIDMNSKEKIDNSQLYTIENVNSIYNRNVDLKIFCEYRFSGVIERICIAALRKTVMKDLIPDAQGVNIFYDPEQDLKQIIKSFNRVLEESDIQPCEVVL
jgi:hypothetical protein